MIAATFFLLIVAAAGFLYRLIVGPSLADRIIGVDGLLAVGAGAVAVEALSSGDGQYIPVIVVITLIGFVSTSVAARFIEAQDTEPSSDNGAVGEGVADRATDGANDRGGTGDGMDDVAGTDPGGATMNVLAQILVLFGGVLMVLSAVGVVRFRDVLARMHALTKASTLGLLFLLGGAALGMHEANDVTSLVLAMALQMLTLPVGANLIAKATYEASAITHRVDVVDELAERRDDPASPTT